MQVGFFILNFFLALRLLNRQKSSIFVFTKHIIMNKYLYRILLPAILFVSVQNATAQESTTGFEDGNNQYVMRESNLADLGEAKKIKPFTFGAEVGASIDMAGNDLSTFDVDIFAGYRSSMIKCLGLGVGLHNSFSSNRQYLPIYLLFRSNLLKNKSLFFVDFRAGYSSNQMCKGENQGGFFGSAGLGINLSVSKRFGSHLLIGYNFYQVSPFTDEKGAFQDINGNHLVSVRLGLSF